MGVRGVLGLRGSVDKKAMRRPEGKMMRDRSLSSLSVSSTATSSSSLTYRSHCDSETQQVASPAKDKPPVSFGTVEIREYPRVLSDNPSVSNGPAIGIGWNRRLDKQQRYVLSVDDYEGNRPEPRNQRELQVPRQQREKWLMEWGYSRKQMEEAAAEIQREKSKRAQTAKKKKLAEKVEEGVQSANRKFKRWIGAMESDAVLYREYKKERESLETASDGARDRCLEGIEEEEESEESCISRRVVRPEQSPA